MRSIDPATKLRRELLIIVEERAILRLLRKSFVTFHRSGVPPEGRPKGRPFRFKALPCCYSRIDFLSPESRESPFWVTPNLPPSWYECQPSECFFLQHSLGFR
jgi:hypothetical protein